ncbi:MAG TPA: hypothetical protein VFZ76_05900 [Anaerolineales bacterium]
MIKRPLLFESETLAVINQPDPMGDKGVELILSDNILQISHKRKFVHINIPGTIPLVAGLNQLHLTMHLQPTDILPVLALRMKGHRGAAITDYVPGMLAFRVRKEIQMQALISAEVNCSGMRIAIGATRGQRHGRYG